MESIWCLILCYNTKSYICLWMGKHFAIPVYLQVNSLNGKNIFLNGELLIERRDAWTEIYFLFMMSLLLYRIKLLYIQNSRGCSCFFGYFSKWVIHLYVWKSHQDIHKWQRQVKVETSWMAWASREVFYEIGEQNLVNYSPWVISSPLGDYVHLQVKNGFYILK